MPRLFVRRTFPAFVLAIASLIPAAVSAQWVKESYPLKAGWNSIWLSQDCSTKVDGSSRSITDVLAGNPQILEVWRWNPLGSSVQFIQSPGAPIAQDSAWAVWRRGDPGNTTLGTLTGNAAYLVKVAPSAPAFTLQLTGKPLVPNYSFSSSGLNFLGFPTAVSAPKFETFFSFSEELKIAPQVFRYIGGALSDIAPKNPELIVAARIAPVTRGQAYWVKSAAFTNYYGPLKVTVLGSGGVDFGRKLNTVTLRIKNVTDPGKNQAVTASFALASSEAAPGQSVVAENVDLAVRGELGPDLQFTRNSLAASAVTLAPGEETDLILVANRANMNVADKAYASILRVTDSLNQTRIDLPVSATGTSSSGIWVGAAVLDSVNRVETILEPEFDAPLGTPNSVGSETSSTVTTTNLTQSGQTIRSTVFVVTFDSAGEADLSGTGGAVTVSSDIAGLSIYSPGPDYTVYTSVRGTITNRGSGYTEAPDVVLVGGGGSGATATATLSAGVRSVSIDPANAGGGGLTYTTAPAVEFSGGGGSGASAIAIIDNTSGLITEVRVTNGGAGYSSAPIIRFRGDDGNGAQFLNSGDPWIATLSGGIGRLTIDQAGSGYTGAPQVTFTRKTPKKETDVDASATVQRALSGEVAGVDVINKTEGGSIGANAWVTLSTTSPAVAGTPDGETQSTVITHRKLTTLNGQSRYSVRRISSGTEAAAPSLFPVRLILHSPASGAPSLLQQVYLGQRAVPGSVVPVSYAGINEAAVAAIVTSPGPTAPGKLGRVSSASFPRGGMWTAASGGSFGSSGSVSFAIHLGHNAETNPFLHTYHPDHDSWDARYERPLDSGDESYTVHRAITLTFSPDLPAGVSDLDWGVTTVGGTYSEIISGLRSEVIGVSGRFILHQVSEVPTLTTP